MKSLIVCFLAVNLVLLCDGSARSIKGREDVLKKLKAEREVAQELASRFMSGKIKSKFESFRNVMKTGKPKYNIPKMDPFDIEQYGLGFNKSGSTVTGQVDDFHVDGLANYQVKDVDFGLFTFKMVVDFYWPRISGKTAYSANGLVMKRWPLFGAGNLTFDVEDFRFASKIQLKLNVLDRKISMTGFENTKISLSKINLNVTGLLNNSIISKSVSHTFTDVVPETLKIYHKQITDLTHEMMMKYGNAILSKYTLTELSNIAG